MIVGHGDIGSILQDREGALFFANGVSNSSCADSDQFLRERELLGRQDKTLCCFYFSSICADRKTTPYYRHKVEMESEVKRQFKNYNIIRLGNISWGTNPNTFLNYIRSRKEMGWPVKIKDEYKYMVDKETLLLLTNTLPLVGQNTISVFSRMAKVKDLIK